MRVPVLYVGLQEGFKECGFPSFHLVDEPSGSTRKFDERRHAVVGISECAKKGVEIPDPLIALRVRIKRMWNNGILGTGTRTVSAN